MSFYNSPLSNDVLGEHGLGFHVNSLGVEDHGGRLQLSHFEENRADLGNGENFSLDTWVSKGYICSW